MFVDRTLRALVARTWPRETWDGASVRLPGGASPRVFLRLPLQSAAVLAMGIPDVLRPDGREPLRGVDGRSPFVELAALLAKHGVRVPRVHAVADDGSWLLVDDLGDETLEVRLERRPDERTARYRDAVAALAAAQASLAELPEDSCVRRRRFDRSLLRWELEHFSEHAAPASAQSLAPVFDALADELSTLPPVFVHRDYQSRNLMVCDEQLVWIDFQDAMLGPALYDLVGLLCDSYQPHDPAFIRARLADYRDASGGPRSLDELEAELRRLALQRKLKDVGRFHQLRQTRPELLTHVPRALEQLRWAAEALHAPARSLVSDALATLAPA